jgi:hypothetical protein
MRKLLAALILIACLPAPAMAGDPAGWPIRPSRPAAGAPAKGKPKAKPKPKAKARCSAAGVAVRPIVPLKAPPKVRAMHQQILLAAADCDFDRLARLALAGRPKFDFTFGDEKRPAPYWRRLESRGEPFLRRLIQVMKLDYAKDGKVYVWPAAAARSATEADWEALVPLFGQREMVIFRDYGGYTEVRLGIAEDGDWIFCVDGD